jgi:Ca2+-binding RTX toxin-like protein
MFFETLEARRLQSSTVAAHLDEKGMLHINGSNKADVMNVTETNGAVSIFTDTGFLGSFVNVKSIYLDAKNGNDIISFSGDSLSARILGGNGNDTISVNDLGNRGSKVDGGNNDDSVTVFTGHGTRVLGGNGNDTLTGALFGGDVTIDAGAGDDTVILQGALSSAAGGKGADTAFLIGPTSGATKIENVVQA